MTAQEYADYRALQKLDRKAKQEGLTQTEMRAFYELRERVYGEA